MTLSRRGFLAGCALSAAWGLARTASADPLDDLLARIAAARAPVRTLQGPFTQTRTIGLLAAAVRSSGTMTLVRPDRLRWELAPPDAVTFFVGPEGLSYRSAQGQGSVPSTSARLAGALEDLRTVLGGDLGKLRDRWSLAVLRDDATGAELEATPLPSTATSLRTIRFALAPGLAVPTRTLLVEGPRDKTLVEFGTVSINVPVDPSRMRPAG
jgi:hypothetical protein